MEAYRQAAARSPPSTRRWGRDGAQHQVHPRPSPHGHDVPAPDSRTVRRQTLGWFAECLREKDPLAACELYAEMSIRQARDFRRTRKQSAKEPGYLRLSVT